MYRRILLSSLQIKVVKQDGEGQSHCTDHCAWEQNRSSNKFRSYGYRKAKITHGKLIREYDRHWKHFIIHYQKFKQSEGK